MEVSKEELKNIVLEHYEENHPEFVITPRILDKLIIVLNDGLKKHVNYKDYQINSSIDSFLEKESVLMFINERQPLDLMIPEEVQLSVSNYFKEHLEGYDLVGIFRSSNAKDDSYLYSVIGKKKIASSYFNGEWACWSSWNQITESLNFGHYNIESIDDAIMILNERFYDISDEKDSGILNLPFYYNEELVEFKDNKLTPNEENKNNIVAFNHKGGRR